MPIPLPLGVRQSTDPIVPPQGANEIWTSGAGVRVNPPVQAPPDPRAVTPSQPGDPNKPQGPTPEEVSGLRDAQARIDQIQAQTKLVEAQVASETDPIKRDVLQAQLDTLRLQQAKAQLDIDQSISPEAKAKLESDLRIKEQELQNRWLAIKADKDHAAALDQVYAQSQGALQVANTNNAAQAAEGAANRGSAEGIAAGREAGENTRTQITEAGATARSQAELASREATAQADRAQKNKELGINTAVGLRGQEIDKAKARDEFTLQTVANQIAVGKLSVDKGLALIQSSIARAKAPSEIMQNVSQAVAPFIPHLTSLPAGASPAGFEAGGPMAKLTEMAGGSYNPSTYAVNPVSVDLRQMAQNAGADFSRTSIPDPNKVFGGISVPNVSGGGTSATDSVPGIGADSMNALMGMGMTDQEIERMRGLLGK